MKSIYQVILGGHGFWWLTPAEPGDTRIDVGPYCTKQEALDARRHLEASERNMDRPGFVSCDPRERRRDTPN